MLTICVPVPSALSLVFLPLPSACHDYGHLTWPYARVMGHCGIQNEVGAVGAKREGHVSGLDEGTGVISTALYIIDRKSRGRQDSRAS